MSTIPRANDTPSATPEEARAERDPLDEKLLSERTPSYDQRVLSLAEVFVEDAYIEGQWGEDDMTAEELQPHANDLALAIQGCIEDWLAGQDTIPIEDAPEAAAGDGHRWG